MDNEPTENKINPMLLAVLMVLALIGAGAILVWLVQVLLNVVIDDYTRNLFSFGEALALSVLAVLFGAVIGAVAKGGTKGA